MSTLCNLLKWRIAALFFCLLPSLVLADEWTAEHWSYELKGGIFLPQDDTLSDFFEGCCNIVGLMEFGPLFQSRYEVDLGVGFSVRSGNAVGATSGRESGEEFTLITVPLGTGFTYRADFRENQILVPYIGAGFDYVYVRESFEGTVTQYWKYGYHGHVGLQILAEWFDEAEGGLEMDMGVNDTYIILEARYAQIDDFGAGGLDLSGFTFLAGFLFEF